MKKLLLVLFVAASATLANAQRSIDWAVDSLITPDTITSTDAGTNFTFEFIAKNIGTDSVMVGDTILYRFLVVNAQNQVVMAYPSTSSLSIRAVNRNLGTGDTVHVFLNLNLNIVANQSANLFLALESHVINRPGIDFEGSATNANNVKANAFTWMSRFGFGVGLKEELANVSLSVYPNPASDVVSFETDYNKAASVDVMDLAGRKVNSASFEFNRARVDVRNLNSGIYIYQVLNSEGQVIKTGKITVNN